jgi:Glutathione S-transferase, N-terminal domain
MILVGQYDSPYVRRVAVSLRVLEFEYEHDTRSVFAAFDAMRATNPLGRIPLYLSVAKLAARGELGGGREPVSPWGERARE